MSLTFNVSVNGVYTPYEFEIFYNDYAEPHVAKTPLCKFLGVNPNNQFVGLGVGLKLEPKARETSCVTLPLVEQFLNQFRITTATKNPDTVKHFKEHFLAFINQSLTPVKEEVSVVEIYNDLTGIDYLRRDLVLWGSTPSEVDWATRFNQLHVISKKRVKPPIFSDVKEPVKVVLSKEVRKLGTTYFDGLEDRISFADYKPGDLLKRAIEPLSQFEMKHPDHELSKRKVDYLNVHDVVNGKIVEIEPQVETMPWDNERSYIGVKNETKEMISG